MEAEYFQMHTGSSAVKQHAGVNHSRFTNMHNQLRYYINFPIVALYTYIYCVLILLFYAYLCIWLRHQRATSPSQVDAL